MDPYITGFVLRLKYAWRLLWADGYVVATFDHQTSSGKYRIDASTSELQSLVQWLDEQGSNTEGCETALRQAKALLNPTP